MIRFVTDKDLSDWLELSKEVEPLFGEMAESEDFKKGIAGCIEDSSAICVAGDDGNIEGIIAFSKAENEILWMAVRERSRSKGYGCQLLKAALDCLDGNKPIYVQTFSTDTAAGKAARKLYLKYGFKDFKDAGKNPAGVDTVIMKLEGNWNKTGEA